MNWEKLRSINPRRFVEKLEKKLRQGLTNNDLIRLYNTLILSIAENPKRYATLSDHLRALFRRRSLPEQAVLFDELSARAYFTVGDAEKVFACLNDMLDLSKSDETISEVLELTQATLEDMDGMGSSIDYRPKVMAAATSIYQRLDRKGDIARVHLKAACHYSTYGAASAAYRSLEEAEEIARGLLDIDLLCSVLETWLAASADVYEHEHAMKVAKHALDLFEQRSEAPPPSFLGNLAVVLMRLGDHERAAQELRRALQACLADSPVKLSLTLNLGTCLRNLNDLSGSAEMLSMAWGMQTDDIQPEVLVELGLSSAKLANLLPEFGDCPQFLSRAAHGLDSALEPVFRLHHRRGLRERYVQQFEFAMRSLPAEGTSDALIDVVAFLRGNALGDWLSVLAWKALVDSLDEIPHPLKQEVARIIEVLRNFGVPHLHGYREKYDDAWNIWNMGTAWDDLSNAVASLSPYGLPRPFFSANLASTGALLRKRLANGCVFMTLTYAGENPYLWTFIGDHYSRIELSSIGYLNWKSAEFSYSFKELGRNEFARQLQTLVTECSSLLQPLLEEIVRAKPDSILFLLDFGGAFPITPIAQSNPVLLRRMRQGELEIRLIPAVHESGHMRTAHLNKVTALIDSREDLLLPRFEGQVFAEASGLELVETDVAHGSLKLAQVTAGSDVLLVSTHGLPMSIYKDPIFAAMGEGHPVTVEDMQRSAADFSVKLVLLNSCYSATGVARNFNNRFRTSDAVNYPSLFLLNGHTVATAAQWPITDTVSFILICLVGDALREGLPPARAISKANATLRDLSKSQVLKLLQRIPAADAREKAIVRVQMAPEEGMYSHPYLAAPVALFTLV